MKVFAWISATFFLALGVAFADSSFKLDKAHSNVNFEVDHLVISTVTGRFDDFTGSFVLDEKGNLIQIEGNVVASSIDTDNKKRDQHLRSADFFDADKFKALTFVSKKGFKLKPGSKAKVSGLLTIKGNTKPVTFEVKYRGQAKDLVGDTKAGFVAETTINRKDFGLNWNQAMEAGGVLVGDEVSITLNVQGELSDTPMIQKK